jgi:hypothetical protein
MGASLPDPHTEHIGEKQVYVKLNKALPLVILDKP